MEEDPAEVSFDLSTSPSNEAAEALNPQTPITPKTLALNPKP